MEAGALRGQNSTHRRLLLGRPPPLLLPRPPPPPALKSLHPPVLEERTPRSLSPFSAACPTGDGLPSLSLPLSFVEVYVLRRDRWVPSILSLSAGVIYIYIYALNQRPLVKMVRFVTSVLLAALSASAVLSQNAGECSPSKKCPADRPCCSRKLHADCWCWSLSRADPNGNV